MGTDEGAAPHDLAILVALGMERDAPAVLAEALTQRNALHLPGARELYRARLERVLALTEGLAERDDVDDDARFAACSARVVAHAARAEDARHGAGQLSRSAQRAPTEQDCELGWQKVERIVANSEASARDAEHLAALLDTKRAYDAARSALQAARAARDIVQGRNHAYTFHTDPGFSFGEGWYVAAAGVLARIEIQIEVANESPTQTRQAEHFLRSAGLEPQLVPYRSRPRANKALPGVIARAFSADPQSAQSRLRAAFLGDMPVDESIACWADAAMANTAKDTPAVLVWVRDAFHHPARNSSAHELAALCELILQQGLLPVLIGDAAPAEARAQSAADLTLFWREPLFQSTQMRRAQLQLFEHLKSVHRLVGQVGVTTAGMDGPALMGLPTMYITDRPNPRLGLWVGTVPGYEEVVRGSSPIESVRRTLCRWAGRPPPGSPRT